MTDYYSGMVTGIILYLLSPTKLGAYANDVPFKPLERNDL
jgi:hypothetical protein